MKPPGVDSAQMRGAVLSVLIKKQRGQMQPVDELSLVEGRGIEGDLYFDDRSRLDRQVLLLDRSTLDDFGYETGVLREQLLVDFPGLQLLPAGTRLTVGDAVVEVTKDCAPCLDLAASLNEEGASFVKNLMGRRGMLAKVVGSGRVKPGDSVRVASDG